jgi:hypothetical protein
MYLVNPLFLGFELGEPVELLIARAFARSVGVQPSVDIDTGPLMSLRQQSVACVRAIDAQEFVPMTQHLVLSRISLDWTCRQYNDDSFGADMA